MDLRERHSAGAVLTHQSPFSDLEVPAKQETPPEELRERWIFPLYMKTFDPAASETVTSLWPEMTEALARTLLGYFNWRPRIVGAYLVALRNFEGLTDLVGRLLLRSDLSDAGAGYCVALAGLNTPASRRYLFDYLDYYLTRTDLWFDQGDVMGAVGYLDAINGTQDLERFVDRWQTFVANKPNWDLGSCRSRFAQKMTRLSELVVACKS